MAARPGRLPGAPQDDPQRPVAPAAGRRRAGRGRARRPSGIDPDRRPQTLAVGEWLALREALGPIGPDGRGRRAPSRPPPRDAATDASPTPATAPRPRRIVTDPLRRLTPGRPPRAGQAQPDARRRRPAGRRLPLAPLGVRAARPGRPAEPGDRRPGTATRSTSRVSMPARRPTTSSSGRSPRPASAVGGGWPGGPGPAPALAARLEKRIPVAAGLAGGSSDAAATVDGALEAWGAELDEATRHAVGRPPRLGRAVLPGRRARPRRGPRRARRAAPRPPRVAGRRPRHAGHRGLDAGRVRRLRRDPARRATGRSGCRPPTSPRSCAPA